MCNSILFPSVKTRIFCNSLERESTMTISRICNWMISYRKEHGTEFLWKCICIVLLYVLCNQSVWSFNFLLVYFKVDDCSCCIARIFCNYYLNVLYTYSLIVLDFANFSVFAVDETNFIAWLLTENPFGRD